MIGVARNGPASRRMMEQEDRFGGRNEAAWLVRVPLTPRSLAYAYDALA